MIDGQAFRELCSFVCRMMLQKLRKLKERFGE